MGIVVVNAYTILDTWHAVLAVKVDTPGGGAELLGQLRVDMPIPARSRGLLAEASRLLYELSLAARDEDFEWQIRSSTEPQDL